MTESKDQLPEKLSRLRLAVTVFGPESAGRSAHILGLTLDDLTAVLLEEHDYVFKCSAAAAIICWADQLTGEQHVFQDIQSMTQVALEALGCWAGREESNDALKALKKFLSGSRHEVFREQAAKAIGSWAGQPLASQALDALVHWLRLENQTGVRVAMVTALGRWADQEGSSEAVSVLAEMLVPDEDTATCRAIAITLRRWVGRPEASRAIVALGAVLANRKALAVSGHHVPAAAIESLGCWAGHMYSFTALQHLIDAMNNPNLFRSYRDAAAAQLSRWCGQDGADKALQALVEALARDLHSSEEVATSLRCWPRAELVRLVGFDPQAEKACRPGNDEPPEWVAALAAEDDSDSRVL